MRMNARVRRAGRGRRVLRLAGDLRAGPAAVARAGVAHRRGHPGRAHRSRRAEVDARRRHRLHRARAARPGGLHPRGLLVLPLAVRAAGHRRDAALGAGQPGGRVRVRHAASVLHPPHRPGPDPRRARNSATSGTSRISGTRACWCRTRSCRASRGCSTRRTAAWDRRRRRREPHAGAERRSREAIFDFDEGTPASSCG